MRKWLLLLALLFLCGCGVGSMERGNLKMNEALLQMAQEMRQKQIGALFDEDTHDEAYLKEVYGLALEEEDYALLHAIRQDIVQEAVIFHCTEENRSIIKEKAAKRAAQADAADIPFWMEQEGAYLYAAAGDEALWMRNYIRGL